MRKIAILSIFILALLALSVSFAAQQPQMSVYVADINVGETAYVSITLPEDAQGQVSVLVNGQTYTADVVDGQANVELSGLNAGAYTVKVTYDGSGNYSSISKQANLKVKSESQSDNSTNTTGNASGEPNNDTQINSTGLSDLTNNTANNNSTNNTNNTNNTSKADNILLPVKPKEPPKKPNINLKDTGLPILVLLIAFAAIFVSVYRKN